MHRFTWQVHRRHSHKVIHPILSPSSQAQGEEDILPVLLGQLQLRGLALYLPGVSYSTSDSNAWLVAIVSMSRQPPCGGCLELLTIDLVLSGVPLT